MLWVFVVASFCRHHVDKVCGEHVTQISRVDEGSSPHTLCQNDRAVVNSPVLVEHPRGQGEKDVFGVGADQHRHHLKIILGSDFIEDEDWAKRR